MRRIGLEEFKWEDIFGKRGDCEGRGREGSPRTPSEGERESWLKIVIGKSLEIKKIKK